MADFDIQIAGDTRRPIFRATSSSGAGTEIPFDGQLLNPQVGATERHPGAFKHSNGAFMAIYSLNGTLVLKRTTEDRVSWMVPITVRTPPISDKYEFPSAVEMSTGNIGILFTHTGSGDGVHGY